MYKKWQSEVIFLWCIINDLRKYDETAKEKHTARTDVILTIVATYIVLTSLEIANVDG